MTYQCFFSCFSFVVQWPNKRPVWKRKKEICVCSWNWKVWGTGCYYSWESFGNSLSCPRSKLSKPPKNLPQFPKESVNLDRWRRRSEQSAESPCLLTISPRAELLPSSVKKSAVYDLKMILSKLIWQEYPTERAKTGFTSVNLKFLNCYCVFLLFSVKSWTRSQHQHREVRPIAITFLLASEAFLAGAFPNHLFS